MPPPPLALVPWVGILVASAAYKPLSRVAGSPLSLFGAYQLNGGYIHLWVQLWQPLLVALADCSLCLLLPLICGMLEYFVQHYQAVGAVLLPPCLAFKQQLYIH